MSDEQDRPEDAPEETETMTRHGHWTPEVSEAADREMRELLQEELGTEPTTEGVDKTDLSLPTEQRPIDH